MNKKYNEVKAYIQEELDLVKEILDSPEKILEFNEIFDLLPQKVEELDQVDRALKIGIVGEVKAGKSTFLNSLLFKGENILPKASTPMTAALTKLSYSKDSKARIVFYTLKEWEYIEELSKSYDLKVKELCNKFRERKEVSSKKTGIKNRIKSNIESKENLTDEAILPLIENQISDQLKACKQLINLYNSSSKNLYTFLGKEINVNIENIHIDLNDYIGANGAFTSIVKHVEINFDNEELINFEIIDTPGLNDPILSRSETTKKFLSDCDVIFLLSYTGQFLKQEDINLMCTTLPREGIKKVVIIGSKYDSGLLDDNKSESILIARKKIESAYNQHAMSNIESIMGSDSRYRNQLGALRSSLPPVYISSLLYSAAIKKKYNQPYNREEQLMIDNLSKQFKDFIDDPSTMANLSGMRSLQNDRLLPLKKEKDEIIKERKQDYLLANKNKLIEILEQIKDSLELNRDILENINKSELEKKHKSITSGLNTIRDEIKLAIQSVASDINNEFINLKTEIDALIDGFMEINIDSETSTERHTEKKWFGLLGQVEYITKKTSYKAEVTDVIKNINNYLVQCKRLANTILKHSIDQNYLENRIRTIILNAFDFNEDSFDGKIIIQKLRETIRELQQIKLEINIEEYCSQIYDEFPNGANNNEIHQLKATQSKIIFDINNFLKKEIDDINSINIQKLEELSLSFIDQLLIKLQNSMINLEKQIEDKDESLNKINDILNRLVYIKQDIKLMEL